MTNTYIYTNTDIRYITNFDSEQYRQVVAWKPLIHVDLVLNKYRIFGWVHLCNCDVILDQNSGECEVYLLEYGHTIAPYSQHNSRNFGNSLSAVSIQVSVIARWPSLGRSQSSQISSKCASKLSSLKLTIVITGRWLPLLAAAALINCLLSIVAGADN